MLRITIPQQIPYGGRYVIQAPEKGIVGEGNMWETLLENVKKYRRANGLPITLSLESDLENLVCQKYPQECHDTDPRVPTRRKLSWRDVLAGTTVMVSHRASGSPLVADEVANERANICANCPFNSDFSKPCNQICGTLSELVKSILGTKTTPVDDRLKSCQICGCFTAASVWLPLETQCGPVSEDQKAQFRYVKEQGIRCWKDCA